MKATQLKKSVIACASIACTVATANPLQPELAAVVQNNPLVVSSRHALDAAQSRSKAAEASKLPTFSIGYDYGRERINTRAMNVERSVGDTSIMSGPGATWSWSEENRHGWSVSSQLPIYNGGKTEAIVSNAQIDSAIAKLNAEATLQDTLFEAISAYLSVAKAKTLIELAKVNETTTTKQLELETKRVDAGGGVKVDAMQAQTRLQIVRERSVYYNQMLREATARYEQTFGRAPNLDTVQDLGILESSIPASVTAALLRARENNPRLKMSALEIDRAKNQLTIARAATKPSVDLVGSINRTVNTGQTANKEEGALYLRANWAFNLGGEAFKREDAAAADDLQARAKYEVTLSRVNEAVRVAWNQVVNGKERLDLLNNATSISRKVMLDRKTLRDAGKETALAALDAEVEYYGVLSSKINTMYEARVAAYRLMAAMGKLSESDIGLDGQMKLPLRALDLNVDALAKAGTAFK